MLNNMLKENKQLKQDLLLYKRNLSLEIQKNESTFLLGILFGSVVGIVIGCIFQII